MGCKVDEIQSHLASTIGAAQTIATALLEAEAGVVEQDLGTIGQREGAVAQVLALLFLNSLLLPVLGHLEGLVQEVLSHLLGGSSIHVLGHVWDKALHSTNNLSALEMLRSKPLGAQDNKEHVPNCIMCTHQTVMATSPQI